MTKHGLNNLLEKTECKTWLHAEDEKREGLLGSDLDLPKFGLPSLEWMLDSEEQETYPFNKTFEQAAYDDIVIIHTSGTTGSYDAYLRKVFAETYQATQNQSISHMQCSVFHPRTLNLVEGIGLKVLHTMLGWERPV